MDHPLDRGKFGLSNVYNLTVSTCAFILKKKFFIPLVSKCAFISEKNFHPNSFKMCLNTKKSFFILTLMMSLFYSTPQKTAVLKCAFIFWNFPSNVNDVIILLKKQLTFVYTSLTFHNTQHKLLLHSVKKDLIRAFLPKYIIFLHRNNCWCISILYFCIYILNREISGLCKYLDT